MIDNSSCLSAIQTIKGYISDCFAKCFEKGSTFSGTENLSNLEYAIDLIPGNGEGDSGDSGDDGSGSGSTGDANIVAGGFSGFPITYAEEPDEEHYTIDFGSYGTNWKAISCYSTSKDGHFNIIKLPNNKCIISGAYFVDLESEWDDNFGIYPMARGTYRASYSISGSSMTFTNAEYDGTSNGFDSYEQFKSISTQASNTINDYYSNPYKLDKINVMY